MSSILKALQKVEDEKAARRDGAGGLTGDLLRSDKAVQRHRRLPLIIPMAAVAVVAVFVTYILMGGFAGPRNQAQKAAPAPVPGSSQTVPALPRQAPIPAATAVIAAPQVPLQQPVRVEAKSLSPAPSPKKSDSRPVAAIKSTTVSVPATHLPVAASPAVSESGGAAAPVSPAKPPASPAPPQLKVSGIAWQKDATSSVAVVNGHTVVKGATVDGFVVEDILPDRVSFAGEGRTFDILIGETAR